MVVLALIKIVSTICNSDQTLGEDDDCERMHVNPEVEGMRTVTSRF